jgi:parallel beta-helix repeat protein
MSVLRLAERSIKNFVFFDVISTFVGGTTTLAVVAGQGARAPTPPFSCVLWDTRWENPMEAFWVGEAETLLVTGRVVDDLTVVRGIEGSVAISSQTGHRYRLIADATFGFLNNVPRFLNVRTYGATGDGTSNDTQAILDALADLPAAGGTIFFPRGTYVLTQSDTITERFRIASSHVQLLGEPGAVIKGEDGADANAQLIRIYGEPGDPITDIEVAFLEFDGNAANADIDSGTQSHIIDIQHAERVRIHDCYFHDSPGDFVRTTYEDPDEDPVKDLWIENNRMATCYRNGISVTHGERIKIEGNQITGYNTVGIDIETNSDSFVKFVDVLNNYVEPAPTWLNEENTNRHAGIQVKAQTGDVHDDRSHVTVEGNKVVGLDDAGTQFPQIGIRAVLWRDVIIRGNQVLNCRDGIDCGATDNVDDGTTGVVEGNTVKGCNHATAGIGIQIRTNISCTGNVCEENEGAGIRVQGRGCTVTGNVCRNNGKSGADVSTTRPAGIWVEGEDNVITGNRCRDTQTPKTQEWGIYLEDGSSNNLVEGNHVTGNDTKGIRLTSSSPMTANDVRQNEGFITEAAGQGQILDTTTSIAVTHGLDITPEVIDITITGRDTVTNDPGNIWISDPPGATTFTVNCRNDPGASGFKFVWAVRPRN